MKNLLASTRSKYLFVLGILAISIGVISKKVISYPTECSPISNQEITFLFKIWNIIFLSYLRLLTGFYYF